MQLLRVFNNNVVLARRGAEDVIVTGRGIGFQAKPGTEVDPAKVVKVFVPDSGRDPDHLAAMIAGIPGEYVQLVIDAMHSVDMSEALRGKLTLVVAIADHIHGAVSRGKPVTYPLEAEVRHLYADDFALAQQLLTAINSGLHKPLAPDEAVAITLHLVNAGFAVGDLSGTYRMTGLIQQILAVIGSHNDTELNSEDISVARFITHLRYLFVRMAEHQQLDSDDRQVATAISARYPDAVETAQMVANLIELRLDDTLTPDEVSYLTLHIARLEEASA
ncbi:PRD domain-containing protein [Corynebacterium aurimucosum]|uniref:Beta-glucoside operon antiterminator n=1 Tax=Corynebacterium aurimucosum (strain ATCC 700975 / DSM 44827 / CIP 107346 / CN-1) TaxID=548476 RepID=C3PJJ5_CORA7|nr:PRD domain-containing protein [Corynebacterium aurimucosum]ACP33881.1 beta-glucoside operon antiterminator [Corynebacterium aurimucosum ATCC 700975]QQU92030.1 PRD domain-containing protein [Corynebacterium aurimucosum]QQU96317.1 PRD domain-containing protein [Corynebacterium aurimucosum]UTA70676.1 PRD domain-containing protein [Corynebacterium aurimucosum]WJY71411.1 Transcription antiterminator LicT [Corynebacterium aurimucosum]